MRINTHRCCGCPACMPKRPVRGGGAQDIIGKPQPKPATSKPDTLPRGSGLYIVKQGDTLSEIAQRHGVSLRALVAANADLCFDGRDSKRRNRTGHGDWIYPGDVIRLPELASTARPTAAPAAKPTAKPAAKPAPTPIAKPSPKPQPTLSKEATELAKAKQRIEKARIEAPPEGFDAMSEWAQTSAQTMQAVEEAIAVLSAGVRKGQVDIRTLINAQKKSEDLYESYRIGINGSAESDNTLSTQIEEVEAGGKTFSTQIEEVAPGDKTYSTQIERARRTIDEAEIKPLPTDLYDSVPWYEQSRATLRRVNAALSTLFDAHDAGKLDKPTFDRYLEKGQALIEYFNSQTKKLTKEALQLVINFEKATYPGDGLLA